MHQLCNKGENDNEKQMVGYWNWYRGGVGRGPVDAPVWVGLMAANFGGTRVVKYLMINCELPIINE
jgi:hypothetical protein